MLDILSKSQPTSKGVSSAVPEASSSARAESLRDLSIHPDNYSEGESDEEVHDDDDDSESVRSSWDYKRSNSPDAEGETESVVLEREEGHSLSSKETERYVDLITEIIDTLEISDAVKTKRKQSRISSSRCKDKGPQALLPIDEHHREVIDRVWNKDASAVSLYKKATRDRYKLKEEDFERYLRVGAVRDEYLVHELERSGVKVQNKNPRLKSKELAAIDSKAFHIETQSLLGMSCAISQSWMCQYVTEKIKQLDEVLANILPPSDYSDINAKVDLRKLADISVLAQDAAIDSLDLQARQAAQAKWIRRSLWVDQTSWAPSLKAAVKRFPTVGDGTICGPNLKDKLEAYCLTSKALQATSFAQKRSGSSKSARPSSGPMPPPKCARFDRQSDYRPTNKSRGRGRGSSYRSHSKPSSSSTFSKNTNNSMSG